MVEFTVHNGGAQHTVRINPAEVEALAGASTSVTRIRLVSGTYYDVVGSVAEVDDKLTSHYTDVRYLAFVLEALCTHLKVQLVRPSKEEKPTT